MPGIILQKAGIICERKVHFCGLHAKTRSVSSSVLSVSHCGLGVPGARNTQTTIDSLRSFLETHPVPEGKKYALVLDNAPWHKKTVRLIEAEMQPEYADIRESVTFIKLPPYSPDLNPIEQVWRVTRRENTHNVFFATVSALEQTVDSAFASWAEPNDQLKKLCTFK